MTQAEIYGWLMTKNIAEPAVLQMGDRFVVGRWESISEKLPSGYMLRSGRVAVYVLGEGSTWIEAYEAARIRLA